MPKFFLDNKEVEFTAGEDILRAALRSKNFIPHYCAHESLSRVATCRMCLVEVVDDGNGIAMPKLQTACSTPIAEGMKVETTNEKVKTARHSIMEFLLINHPLDCAICDQSGECELQNFSFEYGTGKSLVKHEKRVYGWRDIGTFLQLERNRCIHCTRCVRFTQEITGTNEMGVFGRNYQLTVDTFIDYPLSDLFQGNLADICPVGAITTKDFRFKNRVWLEKQTPSVCAGCSTGCNINVCHHKGQVYRFIPRENQKINKWWMCDLGRVSFNDLVDVTKRQLHCLFKKEKIEWKKAIEIVAENIKNLTAEDRVAIITSNHSTNEEIEALRNFTTRFLPQAEIYAPEIPKQNSTKTSTRFIDTLIMEDKAPNSSGLNKIFADLFQSLDKLKQNQKKIKFLFIVGSGYNYDWFFNLVDSISFIVNLTSLKSALIPRATLIIPTSTHLEKKGTFTNKNKITQQNNPAIPAIAGKDEATILFEIAETILDKNEIYKDLNSQRKIEQIELKNNKIDVNQVLKLK